MKALIKVVLCLKILFFSPGDLFSHENLLANLCFSEESQKIVMRYVTGYDALINLGGNCQVSYQMRINGLRLYALPFDTLITPFKGLCALLEHKFKDFLHKDHLELRRNPNDPNDKGYIVDTIYDVRMIHDFKLNEHFLDEYGGIKAKYDRRVERLLKLLETSERVLFIRLGITKDEAVVLTQLFNRLYPHLEYTLLAMATTEDIKENWTLPRVKNCYLKQPEPYVWRGDNEAWKKIFTDCGLESLEFLGTDSSY